MRKPPPPRRRGSGLLTVAFRFAVGQHLDGKRRSDSTFFAAGTYAEPHYWGRGGESKWALLPGWRRACIRWSCVLSVAGWFTYRTVTEWIWGLAGGVAAGLCALLAIRGVNDFSHHRTTLLPLHQALAPVLGIPPSTRPRAWLTVPHDYGTRQDAEIVVYPPPEFKGSERERADVLLAVTAKLGIEAPEPKWQLDGTKPKITFRQSEPPPGLVTSRDILPAVADAAEHEIILGIGKKDQVIDLSLDTEVPHIGFCMTTGDGKSTAAMNTAAQVLHHGGLVVFLDWKLMSHMWARGLPNVAYAGTPHELHTMLRWLAYDEIDEDGNISELSELGRRKQVALASADIRGNIAADIGPRILVIGEELNVMQVILKRYWRRIGGKGPSPAAEAYEEIHHCGRQLRMHAEDIGQRLSARATSGSNNADARENLGAIMFSNPSASTWKMLCDGKTQPPASDHKGRYQLVTRKEVRVLQGALWDEEDARAYALSGVVAVPRHDMPLVVRQPVPALVGQSHAALHGGPDVPFGVRQSPVPPPLVPGVTLREAVGAGLFKTIEGARKTALRHLESTGYRGAEKLYALEDLHAYIARRTR